MSARIFFDGQKEHEGLRVDDLLLWYENGETLVWDCDPIHDKRAYQHYVILASFGLCVLHVVTSMIWNSTTVIQSSRKDDICKIMNV
jgi:hypothetical protein